MFITIAKRTGLVDCLRSTVKRALGLTEIQKQLKQVETKLAALTEQLAVGERANSVLRLDNDHRDLVAQLDTLLDEPAIAAHVQKAITAAPLHTDPYPHIVVEELFPPAFYKLLRKAIPPQAFFSSATHDPMKQNLRMPITFGPVLSVRVLNFVDQVIAQRVITPAVIEKFREPLQRHYDVIFGPGFRERANKMPQSISAGRVMLRRPGYHLSAHRDPKRAMLTCLMYFAVPKDSEAYGTDIFRVLNDREATYTQTYYPEENGSRCELVKRVPFRPNTMLVFLNSAGAHGATIPEDAPAKLERYSYQCYIGPSEKALGELIKDLPAGRQAMWKRKSEVGS